MKDCMFFKLSDKDLILYCHFDYVLSCMRGVNKFMKTLNFDTNTQQLMKNFKTGSCLFQKREMKRVWYMKFEPKNLTETVSMTFILKT